MWEEERERLIANPKACNQLTIRNYDFAESAVFSCFLPDPSSQDLWQAAKQLQAKTIARICKHAFITYSLKLGIPMYSSF